MARDDLPPLSEEQRALLDRLPDSGAGELVTGQAIKTVNFLARRGLVQVKPSATSGFYVVRTQLGARELKTDVEAPRVRRLLERLRKATAPSFDEYQLLRVVFGLSGHYRGIGIDVAVTRLRERGFISTMSAARAVHLLAEQEVAP